MILRGRDALVVGIVLLSLGTTVWLYLSEGVPDRSRLVEVSGHVRSLEKVASSKDGGFGAVRFLLGNDPRQFHYLSNAGKIGEVVSALEQAGETEVGVLFDAELSHSPLFDDRVFYPVFEIRVGTNVVRAHADVAKEWRYDNTLGLWLAGVCLLVSAGLLIYAAGRARLLIRRPAD